MFESSYEQDENVEENFRVPKWLFTLFMVGFVMVLVGVAVAVIASLASGSKASISGVIFVGPIPIVFGAGPEVTWLVLTGIILTLLSIMVLVLTRRKMLKN